MLKALVYKVDNIHKEMGNFSKGTETIRVK